MVEVVRRLQELDASGAMLKMDAKLQQQGIQRTGNCCCSIM
jgi:hypothetical protein